MDNTLFRQTAHSQLVPPRTSSTVAGASQIPGRVMINLTGQAAYLIEDGRVAIVSPIASGKDGWGTPTGNFRVISKDLNQ